MWLFPINKIFIESSIPERFRRSLIKQAQLYRLMQPHQPFKPFSGGADIRPGALRTFPSFSSSGIYGSVIDPVESMYFLRFLYSALSRSSVSFFFTSASSKSCSIWQHLPRKSQWIQPCGQPRYEFIPLDGDRIPFVFTRHIAFFPAGAVCLSRFNLPYSNRKSPVKTELFTSE